MKPIRCCRHLLTGALVFLLQACTPEATTTLWTVVSSDGAAKLGPVIQKFNQDNSYIHVDWRNLDAHTLRNEAGKAGAVLPDWALLPAALTRQLPKGMIQPFAAHLSPRLSLALLPGFRPLVQDGAQLEMLPLTATMSVLFGNPGLIRKGIGQAPDTLGQVIGQSAEFKRRTGKLLFLPSFGDPDELLKVLVAQGVRLLDPQGRPAFASYQVSRKLDAWVTMIRKGDLPLSCLDTTAGEAAQAFIQGDVAMVVGAMGMAQAFDKHFAGRDSELFVHRPLTGEYDQHVAEPDGLVHLKPGRLSLPAQKLAEMLLGSDVGAVLAEVTAAAPVAVAALEAYDKRNVTVEGAIKQYLGGQALFIRDAVTLYPTLPGRDRMGSLLRQALVDAVKGGNLEQLLQSAAQTYAQEFPSAQ